VGPAQRRPTILLTKFCRKDDTVTVEITFESPWIPVTATDGSDRGDISALADKHDHIHGHLSIVIDGHPLKHLGYFGPDDVCLGAWMFELQTLLHALSESEDSRYVYDEGEQGQPAFQFKRSVDSVQVSIIDSEIDGVGDPEWGIRTCYFADLQREIERFSASIRQLINNLAPGLGDDWISFQTRNVT